MMKVVRNVLNLLIFLHSMLNPSLSLDLVRIKSGVSNCVQPILIESREVYELRSLGYSVFTYAWVVDPITLKPSNRISTYVCKDCEKSLRILRRIEKLECEINLRNLRRMIELEGKLLGYPECCIRKFSRLKVDGKNPEKKTIVECIERGVFEDLLRSYPEPNQIKSLFTTNFYPCSLDCKRANEIGERLVEYDRNYRFKIVISIINLMTPVFKIYKFKPKTEFGKLVFSFVESLGELKLKAKKIVEDFSRDPVRFEIDFLRNVMHV